MVYSFAVYASRPLCARLCVSCGVLNFCRQITYNCFVGVLSAFFCMTVPQTVNAGLTQGCALGGSVLGSICFFRLFVGRSSAVRQPFGCVSCSGSGSGCRILCSSSAVIRTELPTLTGCNSPRRIRFRTVERLTFKSSAVSSSVKTICSTNSPPFIFHHTTFTLICQ